MAQFYTVTYSSVDGAGFYSDVYMSLEKAREAADAHQARSDTPFRGYVNPWGYTYRVVDNCGNTLYRTTPA